MSYVNGFVLAVPTANRDRFIEHARITDGCLKEYGALRVVECWAEDVPDGEVTSFPMAVKLDKDETVVFSWIEWPSKDVCDKAMKAMMDDPRFDPEVNPMPFDGKRMVYGGFVPVVDL